MSGVGENLLVGAALFKPVAGDRLKIKFMLQWFPYGVTCYGIAILRLKKIT
jgi:hypothetical protein